MFEYFYILKFIKTSTPLFVIPFVSALIGWITNIIAIKMTFYPIKYFGIRPFGWQGIVPRKSKKMAATAVNIMTSKLINVKDVFDKLNPEIITEKIQAAVRKMIRQIVDEVMEAQASKIWKLMPIAQKEKFCQQLYELMPDTIEDMLFDIKDNITDVLDLKKMTIYAMVEDKKLMNRIFMSVGKNEFRFLEYSGCYLGFVFGLVQMTISFWYNPWWLLPVAGIIVGYATNWMALRMIFEPIKPINFGIFKLQGIFLKRQTEVSQEYARIITNNVLTIDNLFDAIFRNSTGTRMYQITKFHLSVLVDKFIQQTNKQIRFFLHPDKVIYIKNIAHYRLLQELPIAIRDAFDYAHEVLDIENLLNIKMTKLPGSDFINFLRPVFKEDESKLIIVGAVLGGFAGLIQFFVSFY